MVGRRFPKTLSEEMPEFPIAHAESLIISADSHASDLSALMELPENLRQQRPNLVQILGATSSQIILGVFAIEVGYKSHIERLGGQPKRIHNLEELHADLPDRSFAQKVENEFSQETETDLPSFLAAHKNDFIDLRYFFEGSSTKQFSFKEVRALGRILTMKFPNG